MESRGSFALVSTKTGYVGVLFLCPGFTDAIATKMNIAYAKTLPVEGYDEYGHYTVTYTGGNHVCDRKFTTFQFPLLTLVSTGFRDRTYIANVGTTFIPWQTVMSISTVRRA